MEFFQAMAQDLPLGVTWQTFLQACLIFHCILGFLVFLWFWEFYLGVKLCNTSFFKPKAKLQCANKENIPLLKQNSRANFICFR